MARRKCHLFGEALGHRGVEFSDGWEHWVHFMDKVGAPVRHALSMGLTGEGSGRLWDRTFVTTVLVLMLTWPLWFWVERVCRSTDDTC